MLIDDTEFITFLLRAKKSTYAAGDAGQVASSRIASHDLAYREGEWSYLDTYLGGHAFIGQEAVWKGGIPMWGMNYYGSMTVPDVPEGFGDFLKLALRNVTPEAPFRGPARFACERYLYSCEWEGKPGWFRGEELITQDGQAVYMLDFHGGVIR